MNRKLMVLAGGVGLLYAGTAFANDGLEAVRDGCVLGYRQFNDSTVQENLSILRKGQALPIHQTLQTKRGM